MVQFNEEQALVAEANRAFYDAFQSLQLDRMQAAWLKSDVIKCIHPGWQPFTGWDDIMESWAVIFRNTARIAFELTEVSVEVLGGFGWAHCIENILDGEMLLGQAVASNFFQQNPDGRWLMVLHHASPFARRMP